MSRKQGSVADRKDSGRVLRVYCFGIYTYLVPISYLYCTSIVYF